MNIVPCRRGGVNGLEAILQNKASSENMGEVLEMHNSAATKLQSSFRGMKSRAAYKKKKKKKSDGVRGLQQYAERLSRLSTRKIY